MVRNIKIIPKLLLVAAGFLIPIVLLVILLLSEKNEDIKFAEKELKGAELLTPLRPLLYHFYNIRVLHYSDSLQNYSHNFTGSSSDSVCLYLNHFKDKLNNNRKSLLTGDQLSLINETADFAQRMKNDGTGFYSDSIFNRLAFRLTSVYTSIGDESNLVLDQNLNSYYMMLLVMEKIPENGIYLFDLVDVLQREDSFSNDKIDISLEQFNAGYFELRENVKIIYRNDETGRTKLFIEPFVINYEKSVEKFVSELKKYQSGNSDIEKAEIIRNGLTVVTDAYKLWNISGSQLEIMLNERIAGYNRDKYLTIGIVGVVLALTILFFLIILKNISDSVKKLDRAATRVKGGDTSVRVDTDSGDELGNLSKNFNLMIQTIEQNIREQSDRLAQTENALIDQKEKISRTEEALLQTEEFFSKVWEFSGDGMRLTDSSGKIVNVNDVYCKIVNIPRENLIGHDFTVIYKEDDRESYMTSYLEDVKNEKLPSHFERESVFSDGRKLWFSFTNSFVKHSDSILILTIIKDITQRKEAEKELKKSAEQLRKLASHIQSVREEERKIIAREIHDELGQVLTVMKIQVSLLSNKLSEKENNIKEKFESITSMIDNTVDTVQRITAKLRPGILDDLGLTAAIEWQADDFSSKTGIKCNYSLPENETISDQEKVTALFRIFQETLTNIARHSGADRVDIKLETTEKCFKMKISDNGVGISGDEMAKSDSFGLMGMRERALLFDGEVTISGEPGRGTTVCVSIPLDKTGGEKND